MVNSGGIISSARRRENRFLPAENRDIIGCLVRRGESIIVCEESSLVAC